MWSYWLHDKATFLLCRYNARDCDKTFVLAVLLDRILACQQDTKKSNTLQTAAFKPHGGIAQYEDDALAFWDYFLYSFFRLKKKPAYTLM